MSSHFHLLFHQMVTLEQASPEQRPQVPVLSFTFLYFCSIGKQTFYTSRRSRHIHPRGTHSQTIAWSVQGSIQQCHSYYKSWCLCLFHNSSHPIHLSSGGTHTNTYANCTHSTIKFVLLPVSCDLLKEFMFDFCS